MANSIFKPYGETTITGVIREGKKLNISEDTMAFKEVIDKEIAVVYNNVITRYIDILKPYITTIELSDDQLFKYKYKPNLFCYEIYGTPELASSLLYINNMPSLTNFNKNKINVFTNNIMDIIKELKSLSPFICIMFYNLHNHLHRILQRMIRCCYTFP